MATARVVDVALDPRNGGSEAVWTYHDEPGVQVGDGVVVPLGARSALGFVVAQYEADEEQLGFKLSALRRISARVDGVSLPTLVVDLARIVAEDSLCPLPVALSAATPPGVRDRVVTIWQRVKHADLIGVKLSTVQQEVLRVLDEVGAIEETKTKKLDPGVLRTLKTLRTQRIVEQVLRVATVAEKRKAESLVRAASDPARIDAFLAKEGKKKPAQALTLMRLQSAERGSWSIAEIKAMAGVTESTVKALIDAGLLEKVGEEITDLSLAPKPNPAQQLAIDAISDAVQSHEAHPFLLFGVTGSGKTEVYLRAAAEALRAGRSVLYVVPEIALAAQAIAQLRQRFGRSVAVLHSELPATERLQNWLRIRNGEASVAVGARSALFAPMGDIGLIVLDEEHEAAYKQESAPRYHAKQVALALGRLHHCPVVLGSATPSIESFYEAERAEAAPSEDGTHALTLLSLPTRAASAKLPEVFVRDLTEGYRTGSPSILTEELHQRIIETLERKEQVILFLNRRAYSPFLMCRDCGHHLECPHCSVSLSYHRGDKRVRCHHCGYHTAPPDICPKCGGDRISAFGVGTEKVEEAVSSEFPDVRVARLDRDVARRKGALEETLAAFRAGDISILVGTQMIAKGLDFPNVTLVGVIAADMSLNIPDFRSSERTFQLLSQVAGRAGRGVAAGNVVIQTFNPEHPAVVAAQAHDFLSIYEILKEEREAAEYPPFKRLINVSFSGLDRSKVLRASSEAAMLVQRECPDVELLGPVDCAVERIQSNWRRHMVIKQGPTESSLPIGRALRGFDPKDVQVVIDVDPYTLM